MTDLLRRGVLLLIAALMLGSAALPANAQQSELAPEHLALARQYVDLTDKGGLYEIALVTTGVETMRTILTQHPDLTEPLDTAITTTLTAYKERKGDLMDQFARLYALRFSMDELREIVAFYSSPTGTKLATVNTAIGEDMQVVLRIFENNLRIEFFAKVRAELRAAGHDI